MKNGYQSSLESLTLTNESFRHVLYTAKHCQLVLMSLLPKEEIGLETHNEGDQFFRFEKGEGRVLINDTQYLVKAGDSIVVPEGAKHNVINTSEFEELKLYTIYAPPHHKDGIVRKTKEEAITDSPEFDGVTSE